MHPSVMPPSVMPPSVMPPPALTPHSHTHDHTETPTYTELLPPTRTPTKRKHEDENDRHAKARKVAENNYLSAANRQQVNFDSRKNKTPILVGSTVAVKIDPIDRTNTSPSLLPCKVQQIDNEWCTLYSSSGILDTKFHVDDLTPMNNVYFPVLEGIDPSQLTSEKLTTAVRKFAGWSSTNKQQRTMCRCRTPCTTGRCPCRNNQLTFTFFGIKLHII